MNDYPISIIFVGDKEVGKTRLIKRIISQLNTDTKETITGSFINATKVSFTFDVENTKKTINLTLIDTPGIAQFQEFILEQVNLSNFTTPQWALFSYLTDYVDTRGYLTITEEELKKKIPLPDGLFASCLRILQNLDPAGIGATSLTNCLKLQLQRKKQLTPLLENLIEAATK